MNVAIVIHNFGQSSILLQPWRHVYEVARRMIQQGISVTILTGNAEGCSQASNLNGLKIFRIDNLMLAQILRKRELIKAISKTEADVVLWYGTPLSVFYLTRLRATIGKPIVLSIDRDIIGASEILRRISFREFLFPHHRLLWHSVLTAICPRFIFRKAANSTLIDKIIVPSHYLKRHLSKIGVKAHKIAVIPSTIDKDDLRIPYEKPNALTTKLGFQPNDFILTYMGSPCTLRGPDTIIRSIPEILKKFENVKLLILSRRESELLEERYLKKLTRKLGVKLHVQIIQGILSREDLRNFIQISNVIALPFKLLFSEFPLSVLEVMSLGKAIITTNVGTLSEMVDNNRGIQIRPNDPKALARAIIYLMENPEKIIILGKNARRYATNLPDWDHVTQQTIRVLEEVIDETR